MYRIRNSGKALGVTGDIDQVIKSGEDAVLSICTRADTPSIWRIIQQNPPHGPYTLDIDGFQVGVPRWASARDRLHLAMGVDCRELSWDFFPVEGKKNTYLIRDVEVGVWYANDLGEQSPIVFEKLRARLTSDNFEPAESVEFRFEKI